MQPFDLLIQNATLPDGSRSQIGVRDGKICAIAPTHLSIELAAKTIDLQGDLLCPGLVDGHIHLDKTLMGAGWIPHVSGESVRQRIQIEQQILASVEVPVEERAAKLAEQALLRGTTTLRTHVDIYPTVGLKNLLGVMQVRDRFHSTLDIQIVAFPQAGLMSCPGTLDLLDAALSEGADLIGGLDPAGVDSDITGQLNAIFRLAERYHVPIDIHLHDPDYLGIYQIEQIIERTEAMGMQGKVAISHAYCLGMVPDTVAAPTIERLATAKIAIMTNAPGHHAFPTIAHLRAAGVTVFAGSDDVQNAWCPFNHADMLERAMLIAYRSNFKTDADLNLAFEMVTTGGATALGLDNYGIEVGAIADFVVVPARSIPEAIASHQPCQLVFKRGQLVMKADHWNKDGDKYPC
jgi:cytosine/creatinine deaminase